MQKKIIKGFTLIELLVVIAIIGILSGTGVVAYNSYTSAAKETATKSNHMKIVNSMESEFAKCKLDNSTSIFNSTSLSKYSGFSWFLISLSTNNKFLLLSTLFEIMYDIL